MDDTFETTPKTSRSRNQKPGWKRTYVFFKLRRQVINKNAGIVCFGLCMCVDLIVELPGNFKQNCLDYIFQVRNRPL